MDRLAERLQIAKRALATLEDILQKPKSPEFRDAAIQRFEYTVEAIWKAGQIFLRERHGIETASPKATIRSCWEVDALSDEDGRQALTMINDRNLTVHTYNEDLAEQIFSRLPGHCSLMKRWLERMVAGIPAA